MRTSIVTVNSGPTFKTLLGAIAVSVLGLGLVHTATAARTLLPKMPIVVPGGDASKCTLVIKFLDASKVRARHGRLLSLTSADLAPVQTLLDAFGATVGPRFRIGEAKLANVEQLARERSGKTIADLAGVLQVFVAPERMLALGEALNMRPDIEIVQIMAPPSPPPGTNCQQTDFVPNTPDFRSLQTWQGDFSVGGIELAQARTAVGHMDPDGNGVIGIFGGGMAVAVIDYDYLSDHEDLCMVTLEPGQVPQCLPPFLLFGPPLGAYYLDCEDHGTAVLGIIGAIEDTDPLEPNIGMGGVAPMADQYFYPAYTDATGMRVGDAMLSATSDLPTGSIIVVEAQTIIYGFDVQGTGATVWDWVPAEADFDIYLATVAATTADMVVVAAAGNGAQDLDYTDPTTGFAPYGFYTGRVDSGAIIVGAGTPDVNHDRIVAGGFGGSTFGARINVQSWGMDVATLGGGDVLPMPGVIDDRQFYTVQFAEGTSAATAIVGGVCVALQGLQQEVDVTSPLTSMQMRTLLINSGVVGQFDDWGPNTPPAVDLLAAAAMVISGGGAPQFGACCHGDNACSLVLIADAGNCGLIGGNYRGDGTVCAEHCGNTGELDRLAFYGAGASSKVGTDIAVSSLGDYGISLAPGAQLRVIYQRGATNWSVVGQLDGSVLDTSAALGIDDNGELRAAFGSILMENSAEEPTGVVTIYEHNPVNGVWNYEGTLEPELGEPSGFFGVDVVLNEHYALVGDSGWVGNDDGFDTDAGQQVHLFSRNALDEWTESAVVVNPGPVGHASRFGEVIAVAGDLVLVGAPRHDVPAEDEVDSGIVWLYRVSGDWLNGYTIEAVDADGDGEPDALRSPAPTGLGYYGEAIDATGMANGLTRVVISEPGVYVNAQREGRVWIYDLAADGSVSAGPTEIGPTSLGAGARFGTAVSLSEDGLAVSASTDRGETDDEDATGFCWTWFEIEHDGVTAWRELVRLQSSFPEDGDLLGTSINLVTTQTGDLELMAGAPGADYGPNSSGAILVWPVEHIDCDADGVHDALTIARGDVADMLDANCLAGPNGIPDDGLDCDNCNLAARRMADCNEDGIPDWYQDIVDENQNGRDDACDVPCYSQWACPADIADDDGTVDHVDLLKVLQYWGSVETNGVAHRCDIWPPAGDLVLDGDGQVDVLDLITVIRNWGTCPVDGQSDSFCFSLDLNGDGETDVVYPGWYKP